MTVPAFPEVWVKVSPLIEDLPLVAHNSPFDEGCLKAVFDVYGMTYPDYLLLYLQGVQTSIRQAAPEQPIADCGGILRL